LNIDLPNRDIYPSKLDFSERSAHLQILSAIFSAEFRKPNSTDNPPSMPCLRTLPLLVRPSSRHFHIHLNPLLKPRIQVVSNPPTLPPPIDQNHHWNTPAESSPDTESPNQTLFDTDIPHAAPPPDGFDASYKREKLLLERNLDFTTAEWQLIYYIRRTQAWINKLREKRGEKTAATAFLVGGWVRDKILGLQNSSIGVVLDNCDPFEFAQTMIEINGFQYKGPTVKALENHPPKAQHKDGSLKRGPRVWVLNGERQFQKTKVPSVTLLFFVAKFKVRFSPLRVLTTGITLPPQKRKDQTDQTDTDSSPPKQLNYYSAEGKFFPNIYRRQNLWLSQDALFRDLNINAIYLPVSTIQLLDPTKQGFKDIQSRTLQTPRPNKVTFLDCPLRILSTFTQAGQFHHLNFQLADSIFDTLADPEVRVPTPPHQPLFSFFCFGGERGLMVDGVCGVSRVGRDIYG